MMPLVAGRPRTPVRLPCDQTARNRQLETRPRSRAIGGSARLLQPQSGAAGRAGDQALAHDVAVRRGRATTTHRWLSSTSRASSAALVVRNQRSTSQKPANAPNSAIAREVRGEHANGAGRGCLTVRRVMGVARPASTRARLSPQIASEREIVGLVRAEADPDRDDLAVALERHPGRPVGAPEVGRLPAVAGEARVERAVRVVAGEREVAEGRLRRPRRSCRRPGAPPRSPRRMPRRSRSSACRRRRSSCRAMPFGL